MKAHLRKSHQLTLHRETLRFLHDSDLRHSQGGTGLRTPQDGAGLSLAQDRECAMVYNPWVNC